MQFRMIINKITDYIKTKYNELDKQDKIAIVIIIIILLLIGGLIGNHAYKMIKIAKIQHDAKPKYENPTIKKIKTILYMPIYGLKIVLFGSYVDYDNYEAPSAPQEPTPQKQYVKF